MKLKNLAFFGVMGAILSVASANAAPNNDTSTYLTTKGYVDSKVGSVTTNLGENYYNKSQVDTALSAKANSADLGTMAAANTSDYYTKTAADAAFDAAGAASSAETAAKGYTDTKLADYTKTTDLGTMASENKNDYYTKTAADAAFDAAGAASSAETAAKGYTDTKLADYTKTTDLGTMASENKNDYYTKTAADAAFDAAGTASTAIAALDGSVSATDNKVVTGVTTTDGVVTAVASTLIADANVSGSANIAPSKLDLSKSDCPSGRTCMLTYDVNGNYAATPITNASDLPNNG